jgi:hypothetical protein
LGAGHEFVEVESGNHERLHLCCKGSCEFVESSHRTVLAESSPTVKFLILQKQKTDPPLDSKISIGRRELNIRFVPQPDKRHCSKSIAPYGANVRVSPIVIIGQPTVADK